MEIRQLLTGTRRLFRWRDCLAGGMLLCLAHANFADADAQMLLQTSRLAGFRYYEGKQLWQQLHEGDALELVREADNIYDSHAIRVDWHGHTLGYVPRTDNAAMARLLDHGVKLQARIVRLMLSRNVWQRILFEVYQPL